MATRFHTLRVARKDPLTDDAVAITFDVPAHLAPSYAFRAGQWLTVRHGQQRRSYSICAAVGQAPRIGVRRVPGGQVSGWLVDEVRPGDAVEVLAPAGTFTPDPSLGGHQVLLGAGSGITPLLSIAGSLLAAGTGASITLCLGNRRADSVMFADEIADLKDRYPSQLSVVHVFSREAHEVEIFHGRLDGQRLRTLLPMLVDVPSVQGWWLCGPYPMAEQAADALAQLGVPAQRVHRELFFVDDQMPTRTVEQPPAAAIVGARVTLVLDGRSTELTVPAGVPVLDAAQRVRPDLPFACKGGVCGTCRARVVQGSVTMRRNFALEPAELAAGYVLTCQSLPATEQVVLDYDA